MSHSTQAKHSMLKLTQRRYGLLCHAFEHIGPALVPQTRAHAYLHTRNPIYNVPNYS